MPNGGEAPKVITIIRGIGNNVSNTDTWANCTHPWLSLSFFTESHGEMWLFGTSPHRSTYLLICWR